MKYNLTLLKILDQWKSMVEDLTFISVTNEVRKLIFIKLGLLEFFFFSVFFLQIELRNTFFLNELLNKCYLYFTQISMNNVDSKLNYQLKHWKFRNWEKKLRTIMGNLALSPQLSFNGLLILSEYSFLTHFAFYKFFIYIVSS